jgi:hypothetical protein
MNQGTQGYHLKKKTEGRKSRETVPLRIEWVQVFKSNIDAQFLMLKFYPINTINTIFQASFLIHINDED